MGERFGGIVRLAARRPLAVLGLVAVLALGGAALALRLQPSADTDTLVNRSSATFKATQKFKKTFGDEAVVILIKGNLQRTVLTSDLGRVLRLEGCLSGNVPARGLAQLPPECTELHWLKPAKVVYGPGTFINTAANQISDEFLKRRNANSAQAALAAKQAGRQAARQGASPAGQRRAAKQASDAVVSQFTQQALQVALRYGLTGLPSITDPDFVSSLVFDSGAGRVGEPKARFAFLFPSKNAALIQIRMKPDLSNSERRRAIDLFERATRNETFKPKNGAHYVVTGVPVVAEGLATAVQHSIFVLLAAALLVMAATLSLVFRTRLRLLPLALALAAAAMTFGALSLAGGNLTMASIAVLPVLIGLAVDYAIQFQARFAEPRERPADLPPSFPRLRKRLGDWGTSLRESRAAEWLADRSWRALHGSIERPRRVLAIGLALAVVGWVVDTQSKVVSDVRELVPANLQALKDVNQLEKATGVSGEIDVTVHAKDITDPAVVAWMTRFQQGALKAHGYKVGARCSDAKGAPELCPALSLPDLFSSGIGSSGSTNVRQLLAAVPPYFSQGVVSADRKTANMAFGIRLMPLDRQQQVVDDIEGRLNPPKGVQASVVGLPVLAAEANGELSSPWRRDLTLLAALAGVFLVLLAVRRSRREAAVPLIPIALATGWSGALLFVLGLLPGPLEVDLNPMSVTLSALVIAISTEFSVLLSSRYRQERDRGAGPARAIQLTYASTGAAVLASGATAIAGFAALIASDIRMLRDFGIVTVADLTISLLGVMVVLPAALLWAEQHGPFTLADLDPRPLVRELWDARPEL